VKLTKKYHNKFPPIKMVLRRKFPTKLCPIPRQEAIHTECLRRNAEMHSLMAELGQMQRQQQEQLQRFSVNSAEETKEARQRFVVLNIEGIIFGGIRLEGLVKELNKDLWDINLGQKEEILLVKWKNKINE
jgi:hypothetical protein